MKIAASDYDGTLFRNNEIAAEDARGVHAWRAAGHKFGVVTGRDYGMLVPQLHHYGVEFDYAVCNNGGIIHPRASCTPSYGNRACAARCTSPFPRRGAPSSAMTARARGSCERRSSGTSPS